MIQANNLSLSFGEQEIFQDISFNVHEKERIGLIGRNGSGKSTLFKIILDQLTPDSGSIRYPKNYTLGCVDQHISFSKESVREECCLGLPENEKDQVWQAEKILSGLGFSQEDMDKDPQLFSGGYQVRLNLARVLVSRPDMLLLDEPTNYLDIVSIRWLCSFLRQWEGELILITHDRGFMNSVTTHTMAIHRCKIKKIAGDTVKMNNQIALEEEVYERSRKKDELKRKHMEQFVERFRSKATLAKMVQSRIKAMNKMTERERLAQIETLEFSFNEKPFNTNNMLKVKNLSFGYDPDNILIDQLSFVVEKGDRICVVGKNGKGKSTLLKLLAEKLTPLKGKIETHNNTEIGYFGQTNIEQLNPNNSIVGEYMDLEHVDNMTKGRSVCGALMFPGKLADKPISVLSGGEKSRVMLGKILLSPTNLLLLDEPTNHLDIDSCDSLIAALDVFGGASIVVTHNEMFLHHLATKLIIFDHGEVFIFDGSYKDFLDQQGFAPEDGKDLKIKPAEKKGNSTDSTKKELKKEIRSIQRDLDQAETQIKKLKQDLETLHLEIAELSQKGSTEKINKIQIDCHKKDKEIEAIEKNTETLLEQLFAKEEHL